MYNEKFIRLIKKLYDWLIFKYFLIKSSLRRFLVIPNSMNKKYIENITQWIINKKDITYPISFSELMKKYKNIKVFMTDSNKLKKDDISWLVQKKWNEYEIYINKKQSKTRMAFTLAHELWHIMLEHFDDNDILVDSLFRDNKETWNIINNNEKEKEANFFASCLLMPKDQVLEQWNKHKKVSTLAVFFNVSEAAMWSRIMNLWLLNKF